MVVSCLLAESGVQILLEDGSGCVGTEQVSILPDVYPAWWESSRVGLGALTANALGAASRPKNCPVWGSALSVVRSGGVNPWQASALIESTVSDPYGSRSSVRGNNPWGSPSGIKKGP